MKHRRIVSLLLAFVMSFTMVLESAMPAFAAETDEETTSFSTTVSEPLADRDNDERFAAYAESLFYGTETAVLGDAAGEMLSADAKVLYDALKPVIKQIAAGQRESAKISLGAAYTDGAGAEVTPDVEITLPSITEESVFSAIDALLADMPYEMYWYDKVTGCKITSQGPTGIDQVVFALTVAAGYRGADEYTADTSITGAATTAVANAQTVLDKYAGVSDYEKLVGYKDEICALVSYNNDAASAGSFTTDSDPWQLIYVFDGDTSTNVVCEGYSKAFMYLCDMTEFSGDVACYTVMGTMDGGDHMWNIVSIGGSNYLVDVTNSDDGTVGADGSLFMKAASGSIAEGYTVNGILYIYDDDTTGLWGTGDSSILNVSLVDYSEESGAEEITYTVTFDTQGIGETPEPITVVENGYVTSLPEVTADGYTFIGWYYEPECVTLFTMNEDLITSDVTLYAYWETVSVDSDTSNEYEAIASGNYSENIIWTLYEDGELIVEGTGEIADTSSTSDYIYQINRVTIKEGIETLLSSAWFDYDAIETVTIAASVILVDGAFDGCNGLKEYIVNDDNPNYCSIDGVLYDKAVSRMIRCPISKEGVLNIPDSVTEIATQSAYACSLLSQVNIGSGVETIGDMAFSNCAFTEIEIPSNVKYIGEYAFHYNTCLTKVVLNEGLLEIGANAFTSSRYIEEFNIPASVTNIGKNAFHIGYSIPNGINVDSNNKNYSSINGVLYNKDATTLIKYPYRNNTNFIVPDGVKKIDDFAFYNMILDSLILPDGLEIIGEQAFYDAAVNDSLIIPDTVTEIGEYAFAEFSTNEFKLPSGITELPVGMAFYAYLSNDPLVVPENVTVMRNSSLQGSEIRELYLYDTIQTIEDGCASYCPYLTDIYYHGSEEEWNNIDIGAESNEAITDATKHFNARFIQVIDEYANNCYISVDKLAASEGDTVTITVQNGYNYEVDKLFVNGVELEGNTFVVEGNSVVTATYKPIEVTITFDTSGIGTAPEAVQLQTWSKLESLPTGSADGYCITGWYYEPGCIKPVTIETDYFSKDTTIYAKWEKLHATASELPVEPDMITVTFDTVGRGTAPDPVELERYTIMESLPTGSANGYCITGWYYDTEYTDAVTLETDRFYKDTTIYAKWEKLHATASDLPTEPEDVVDTTITEDKASEEVVEAVKETVTVEEGKATVSKETVEAVVNATQSGETVVLPLTETTEETVTEAVVNTEAVKTVAQSESDVVIQLTDVTVKLDSTALTAVTEQATGENIEIKVVKVEEETLTAEQQAALENKATAIVVTAQIYSNGEYIGDFNGGTATIMLPFTPAEGKTAEDYAVYYVAEDGTLEKVNAEYIDGNMVFTTTHFSEYVIVDESVDTEHANRTTVPGYAATCTTDGLTDGVWCPGCQIWLEEQEVIPATGHTEGEAVVENKITATCTTAGGYDTVIYCTICESELSRVHTEVPATGHAYDDGVVTTEPTCENAGVKTFTCANDSTHTYTEEIGKLGHDYESAVTAPTCTAKGFTTHTCKNDPSHTYVDSYVDELGHKYVVETIKQPTCTETGWTIYVCENDDDHRRSETIDATGHDYTTVVTPATCTEKGYTTYTCKNDSTHTYKDDYVDAKGHTAKTVPAVAATCTSTGLTAGEKCSVCGVILKEQKVVAKTDHNFGEYISNGNGTQTRYCANCDAKETVEMPNVPSFSGVIRIRGSNRYKTAYAIADAVKENLGLEKFETIIIASGNDFPDALAGSYLAKVMNAPILLGSGTSANNRMLKSFIDLNLVSGGKIYILGSEAAIPSTLDSALTGYDVERIAGSTRYNTNMEILKKAGVTGGDIIVATGTNFADSLSASAVGLPILLVNGARNGLTDRHKAYLATLDIENIYIMGSEAAVNKVLEEELKDYGNVERVAGTTRYSTSVAIANKFFPEADKAVMAYALNYPDGLCGGPLAMSMNAPLILTKSNSQKYAKTYTDAKGITSGVVLGSGELINNATAMDIFNADEIVVK